MGLVETTANTNIVDLSDTITPAPTPTPIPDPSELVCNEPETTPGPTEMMTPIPEATPSPTPEDKELAVINDNSVAADNNATVTANTGENTSQDNVDVSTITTGDATALANVVNVLNTNIVGSNFQILSIDVTGEDGVTIDLNELWQQILLINENGDVSQINWPSSPNLHITIINSNQATLTNTVDVTANTGGNTATGNGSSEITTGDAVAAANVANMVNTNIVGSTFLLGYINILPGSKINLILPRPELFGLGPDGGVNGSGLDWFNYNLALISNNIGATATTGGNTGEGGNILTGDALAVANSVTIANTNISLNNWFFLILNNLGGWDGQILGWSAPDAVDQASIGSNILQAGGSLATPGDTQEENSEAIIVNDNEANVTNNVNVTANTGQNTATGNHDGSNITTGNAAAIANLLNLVNLNILGSRWFMGMVNVLGSWGGKVIFAYPDVTVSLSMNRQMVEPGDIISYNLHYENVGYDTAKGVKVNLDLPEGMSFVASSGKLAGGCEQTYCGWEVGSLTPRQTGDITIDVKIDEDFDFNKDLSFWSKLIPTAKAEGDRKDREVNVQATIATSDPESNTSNNSFSVSGVVYEKLPGGGVDQRQPALTVSAWNNVNEFVYPGDIVTFVATVKNRSDVAARNARLVHKLYDPQGNFIGSTMFDLGTLEAGKGGKVSFGLSVPKTAKPGIYKTVSLAVAEAPNGNNVTSDTSATQFGVKTKSTGAGDGTEIAMPAKPESGEVLGAATSFGPWCTDRRQDIWIFVMLLLTSTALMANRLEDRFNLAHVLKNKISI
jgi:uncharacterized repeat protein (TIGR01451 family)